MDEVAYSTRRLSRRTCRAVAEFTFRYAQRNNAKVFGGPKYTVSPVYEGMFKEELDAAHLRNPDVEYDPQLIDATYALLLGTEGEPLVIPALNRDGDNLSDLVMKMFGTIAGLALFVFAHQVLFLASTVLALYGWHRKREAAAVMRKILIQVDEIGQVSECQIDATNAR